MSDRGFVWRYQPFGAWCEDTVLTVQWNPWLNTHQCRPAPTLAEAEYPGWTDRTDACRESTGQPWRQGSPFAGDPYCSNGPLIA